jgi:hypothetical protein
VTEAILESGQALSELSDLASQAGLGDFETARSPAAALVVVVESAAQFRFQGLDLFAQGASLPVERLPFGIGNEAVLGLRVGSVLHDLVMDGVLLWRRILWLRVLLQPERLLLGGPRIALE